MNILVCGPPCAGKTTWVEQTGGPTAPLICYDTTARNLGWFGPRRPPFHLGRIAEAEVQRQLAALASEPDGPTTYVIRTMAGKARRTELAQRIHAEIVVLVPPRAELITRAAQRHDPLRTLRDIDAWFALEAQG